MKTLNSIVFFVIIALSTTSFWLPNYWYDRQKADPFIGEYNNSCGDTTYIFYATYNAESIVKRDMYLQEHYDTEAIKCISLDEYYSLYIEDIKEKDLINKYNIKVELDNTCMSESFNWNYTIFKYNNNILVKAF